ncbi:MAG: putative methyltransferase [Clostridiales bacterium]|jgi:predicted methyltransferase|nr:putative methyltransferase [Clostridiales bacterium]
MIDYIEHVYSNVNIDEGPQAIEQLLLEIFFHEGISTKELARKTLLPVPLVAAIKREFIKAGLVVQDRGVRLSGEGKNYIENQLGYKGLNIILYNRLMNDEWTLDEDFREEIIKLNKLFDERPQVDVTVDQSKCTVETSIKRAILCLKYHCLIGKKILCLGDDDLVSVSIGFIIKKLFYDIKMSNTEICILDVDNRFLKYIEEIAATENLPIQCVNIDLRFPIEDKYKKKFDCFFTDPPYTLDGMRLFISRGISCLKSKMGLPIFLSFAHKSPNFAMEMQRVFINMGLVAAEIIPRFNKYEGAEIIGNSSQMIVLKTTGQTSPEIEAFFNDAIYTGEIKKTIRIYKCKKCGLSIKVGFKEKYRTIEELKNKRCPECNENTFELESKTYYTEV